LDVKGCTVYDAGADSMLSIKRREVGDVTVVVLEGSLLWGLGLESLRPHVEQLVAEQRLNIVLNAQEVSVIDSSGVGELVACFSLVKKRGGSLKVANPTKLVREVLKIAHIPTIIEVYDSEEAALRAFEH
jgi:anti-sigma B factor antagonist